MIGTSSSKKRATLPSTESSEGRVAGLGIFDARVVSKDPSKSGTSSAGIRLGTGQKLHANAARWNEALQPKNFVYKKKNNKKKLSILKKKILMERLKRHIMSQKSKQDALAMEQSKHEKAGAVIIGETESSPRSSVLIRNFLGGVDLDDRDELEEVAENVKELLGVFVIHGIRFWINSVEQSALVEVVFGELSNAAGARDAIDGAVFGGSKISAVIAGNGAIAAKTGLYQTSSVEIATTDASTVTLAATNLDSAITHASGLAPLLLVHNLIVLEDVLMDSSTPVTAQIGDESEPTLNGRSSYQQRSTDNMLRFHAEQIDGDNVEQICEDIYTLCAPYGVVSEVHLEYHYPHLEKNGILAIASTPNVEAGKGPKSRLCPDLGGPLGVVEFDSLRGALSAAASMNGRVVGGKPIRAMLWDVNAHRAGMYHTLGATQYTTEGYTTEGQMITPVGIDSGTGMKAVNSSDDIRKYSGRYSPSLLPTMDRNAGNVICGIRLHHFTSLEELADAEELSEIQSNIADLFKTALQQQQSRRGRAHHQFGVMQDVRDPEAVTPAVAAAAVAAAQSGENLVEQHHMSSEIIWPGGLAQSLLFIHDATSHSSSDSLDVLALLPNLDMCIDVLEGLDGCMVGGSQIVADVIGLQQLGCSSSSIPPALVSESIPLNQPVSSVPLFEFSLCHTDYSTSYLTLRKSTGCSNVTSDDEPTCKQSPHGNCNSYTFHTYSSVGGVDSTEAVVVVQDLITEDDLEEARGDLELEAALKQDLISLCRVGAHSAQSGGTVAPAAAYAPASAASTKSSTATPTGSADDLTATDLDSTCSTGAVDGKSNRSHPSSGSNAYFPYSTYYASASEILVTRVKIVDPPRLRTEALSDSAGATSLSDSRADNEVTAVVRFVSLQGAEAALCHLDSYGLVAGTKLSASIAFAPSRNSTPGQGGNGANSESTEPSSGPILETNSAGNANQLESLSAPQSAPDCVLSQAGAVQLGAGWKVISSSVQQHEKASEYDNSAGDRTVDAICIYEERVASLSAWSPHDPDSNSRGAGGEKAAPAKMAAGASSGGKKKKTSSANEHNAAEITDAHLKGSSEDTVCDKPAMAGVGSGRNGADRDEAIAKAVKNAEKSSRASLYTAAALAPKLEKHGAPWRDFLPVADDATNASIKELLTLIAGFQARLKEKNPTKAKLKLRFVAGIKQSTNGVKGGKARLLLLAPNTEASEELDSRIGALLQLAAERDPPVPAVFCLSKRLLGKAAQLTMKQSVIAVYDPDGAYEHFKKIVRFIDPDRY